MHESQSATSPALAGTAIEDLKAAASAARLRYVSDKKPGIQRVRSKKGFDYFDPKGNRITDEETLSRIRKLAIPPAYEDVWICPDPNGHLQAVGRDARGRKQYRYHARWRAVRDQGKYGKLLIFGKVLPRIRERVEHDLSLRGLPREKVLAAVVRLLETTLMRVGNEEYAKTNKSYGLTTLRNRHVKVKGSKHIILDFRGKHGTEYHIDLYSQRLAQIVRRCQDLPGQDLFQYLDENGTPRGIGSEEVNDYLQEITGEEITAKDFRTWAATNLAALALKELEQYDSQTKAKRSIVQAVESVSKMLGNTPAICRKCYIHPAIFDGYLDGSLREALKQRADAKLSNPDAGLKAEEAAVMAFLRRQLASGKRLLPEESKKRTLPVTVVARAPKRRTTSVSRSSPRKRAHVGTASATA
jgi:DNA topoisomerase-1